MSSSSGHALLLTLLVGLLALPEFASPFSVAVSFAVVLLSLGTRSRAIRALSLIALSAILFNSAGGFEAAPPVTGDWPFQYLSFDQNWKKFERGTPVLAPPDFLSVSSFSLINGLVSTVSGALFSASGQFISERVFFKAFSFLVFVLVPLSIFLFGKLGDGGLFGALVWTALQPHHFFLIGNVPLYLALALSFAFLSLRKEKGKASLARSLVLLGVFLSHGGVFLALLAFILLELVLRGEAGEIFSVAVESAPVFAFFLLLYGVSATPAGTIITSRSLVGENNLDYVGSARSELAAALPLAMLSVLSVGLLVFKRDSRAGAVALLLFGSFVASRILSGIFPAVGVLFGMYFLVFLLALGAHFSGNFLEGEVKAGKLSAKVALASIVFAVFLSSFSLAGTSPVSAGKFLGYDYFGAHGSAPDAPLLSGTLGEGSANLLFWMGENPLPFPLKSEIGLIFRQVEGGFVLALLPEYSGGQYDGRPYPPNSKEIPAWLFSENRHDFREGFVRRSVVVAGIGETYATPRRGVEIFSAGPFSVLSANWTKNPLERCAYSEGRGHFLANCSGPLVFPLQENRGDWFSVGGELFDSSSFDGGKLRDFSGKIVHSPSAGILFSAALQIIAAGLVPLSLLFLVVPKNGK